MGGVYSTIGRLATEGLENLTAKVGSKIASSPIAKDFAQKVGQKVEAAGAKVSGIVEPTLYRGMFQDARSFAEHPAANDLYNIIQNEYKPKVNQEIARKVNQATSSFGPKPSTQNIIRNAHKDVSDQVFGPNRVMIQGVLKKVEADSGKNKSDILADHLNIILKEAEMQSGHKQGLSQFNVDMARKDVEGNEGIHTPTTPFKHRNDAEEISGNFRAMLAHGAAPIHAITAGLNILQEDGLQNLVKTLNNIWGPGSEAKKAQILASNQISELVLAPYREQEKFEAGIIHSFAPNSVGEFVHRNMYIPGIQATRRQTLFAGASAGKLMAEEAAAKLAKGNDKWANVAFKELDIDPAKIARQGFQLLPEDIDKAYYHGANNRVFLDPYDKTPSFWRQSPLWRSMKAFTGYVTQQQNIQRRIFMKQYRQGDFVGIARNMATLSLVFPLVGSLLYEFDRIRNGEDKGRYGAALKARVEATPAGQLYNLATGQEDPANMAKTINNTIDMFGRLGVWGATTSYVRGANRASLAEHFLPPELNMAVQLGQDAIKATQSDKRHPDAATPFKRDILSDIPSLGAGTFASHEIYPTKAERDSGKIKKSRRSRKVQEETTNPFRSNDFSY